MATTVDNERYLRHILLLGEGGLLVLRGIVTREAASWGQTLEHILATNRALFHNLIQEQYKELFPSTCTVNANVQTWDMSLLMVVVKRLFQGTPGISLADTTSISTLKTQRNYIQGHPKNMSLSKPNYDTSRRLLESALLQLASGISADTVTEINGIIRETKSGNIDIASSLRHIREIHAFKTSFLDALESKFSVLTDMLSEIGTSLKNMDENQEGRYGALQTQLQEIDITTGATKNATADIKACLDNMNGNNAVRHGALQTQLQEIDINTGATKNDMAEMKARETKYSRVADKILKMEILNYTRHTKKALHTIIEARCDQRQKEKDALGLLFEFVEMIQNRDDFSKEEIEQMIEQRIQWHGDLCLQLVDDLLCWFTDMRNIPDAVPGRAKLGCIRLPIECSSMKGMLKHLEYMKSDECKQRLSEISCSLSKMLGFSCCLSWTIVPDSLKNVMKTLSEESKTMKIVLPFESKSLEGLTNMWTFFEGEEANSHLTKISETLSKLFGANVSLTASIVMDQFTKAVYERSKDSLSSSINTKVQGEEQLGNIQGKAEELPQEHGLNQHTVEIKSEEKSPKPKGTEHDSESSKNGSVKRLTSYRNQVLARTATKTDLLHIAKAVGSNWEMLGPYLLKENVMDIVDQIKEDTHDYAMRIYHLLLTWSKRAAPDTTLGQLFHQMLQVDTSVTVEWRTIAKYLDIDERDIRACK